MNIPFNKPYLTGEEVKAISLLSVAYDNSETLYHDKCLELLSDKYKYHDVKLIDTTLKAYLFIFKVLGLQDGDEVVIPAISSPTLKQALSKIGAEAVLSDCSTDNPNANYDSFKEVISDETKLMVVSHFGGSACSMAPLIRLAKEYDIPIVEDVTDSLDTKHRGEYLGKSGAMSILSFHQSKNIIAAGDAAAVVINDKLYLEKVSQLFNSDFNKPEEINCAFLYSQLSHIDSIQRLRLNEWINYYNDLEELAEKDLLRLPLLTFEDRPNGHVFYIVCKQRYQPNEILTFLRARNCTAMLPHQDKGVKKPMVNAVNFNECAVLLPIYNGMTEKERQTVTQAIKDYYKV